MPDRNFIRPMMPTQADVMYALNTITDRSDDLLADAQEEQLARKAEKGNRRLRRSRIVGMALFLLALALVAVYLIANLLTH